MADGRRVLGLRKTQVQANTERHEDALMQKVAEAENIDASRAEAENVDASRAEPSSSPPGDEVPAEEVIVFDEKVPYAEVRGIPGVAFIQGRDYFDRGKKFVREAPSAQWYFAAPVSHRQSDMERAEQARNELKRKGLWHNVPGHDAPRKSLIGDIEKENARAAAAVDKLAE